MSGQPRAVLSGRSTISSGAQPLGSNVLHVMNGHSMCPIFERSNLPGAMTVYADPLHEGPVPANLSDEQMREVRARYLAGRSESWDKIAATLREWDSALEGFRQHDEVVLWFEHDLFDQLLLIRHLAWFARRSLGTTRLSLVCRGAYPGIEPFRGLGELSPDQLASLFEARAEVSSSQLDLGARAWEAFTSPDPEQLERLLGADTTPLEFLGPALRRHAQEFPAVGTGLPRIEREILTVLAASVRSPVALFREEGRRESCFFIGDTQFRWRLDAMAASPQPLISMDLAPGDAAMLPRGTIAVTETGRAVLEGRTDWISLAPFDRWLGGIHVREGSMWRWDDANGRFVR